MATTTTSMEGEKKVTTGGDALARAVEQSKAEPTTLLERILHQKVGIMQKLLETREKEVTALNEANTKLATKPDEARLAKLLDIITECEKEIALLKKSNTDLRMHATEAAARLEILIQHVTANGDKLVKDVSFLPLLKMY